MGVLKTRAALLVRFLLCFALIACLWIASIRFRIGAFRYEGQWLVADNSGAFTYSDGVLLAATVALLVGLIGLYRSGRVSAVLMVLASLVVITTIDDIWGTHGYVDEYKGVPSHVLKPAIAAALICPLALLFPEKREADGKLLAGCWVALALAVLLLGTRTGHNMLGLQSMIGPSYMLNVFLCLLMPEILRQIRRLRLAYGVDRLTD
jgi:hypothetical protein